MYNSDTIDLEDSFLAEGGTKGGYSTTINDISTVNPNDESVLNMAPEEDQDFEPLSQFTQDIDTQETFKNLTEQFKINTMGQQVINIAITYGSKYAIALVNQLNPGHDQDLFHIQCYSLNSFLEKWSFPIRGTHIKMKEIEQSDDGETLAICYQDDGKFWIQILKSGDQIESIDLINVSQILYLDNKSKGISGFWEPMMTCAFIPAKHSDPKAGSNLMICVYHRQEQKQYHFVYSYKDKKMIGQTTIGEIKDCTVLNFPVKSFYSPFYDQVYTFYRQGQGFTINAQDPKVSFCEKITTADLGSMYLLFDQALIVRSSSSILFFKIDPETHLWTQYHVIPKMRGNIFFIKGNVRFQITTDEKIYFYLIDKVTLMPKLENVMYNFMNCSQMMFGSLVRYCITFKTNQPNFSIWVRKAFHNFKVSLTNESMEGSMGVNLPSLHQYVMTERKKVVVKNDLKEKHMITVHDVDNYKVIQEWAVPTREEGIEILYITVSKDDKKIGLALGKRMVKDHIYISEIAIYERQKTREGEEFALQALKEFQHHEACMRFEFRLNNSNRLLFFQQDKVFEIDITDESYYKTVYKYKTPLVDQPSFGVFNATQDIFIVASPADARYCNMKSSGSEVDLDEVLYLSSIQSITHDDENFYILANKKNQKLGFYLFLINQNTPQDEYDKKGKLVKQNMKCLISWQSKLDIGNCDMAIMQDSPQDSQGKKSEKLQNSIVVSYKMIGINTFNVFCINLDGDYLIRYWYEGYQLWESPVKGFLLTNNDFMMLSKDGINLIALGNKEQKLVIDKDNQKRLMHSLGSCDYLKIEPTNHLLFACQFYNDRQICLQEQYNDKHLDTNFDDIFKIKIDEVTLRELLLIESIYNCRTQSDISLLVDEQPNPMIFFKVFLELGIKSLVPYIAFDTKSMRSLLDDKNKKYFKADFPLFYKNEKGRSAIDTALENNQIRSINMMIDYIVEYQNSYYYAHLFNFNVVELLNKGVYMTKLFESNIFNHEFDYDEWPSTNNDIKKGLAPYNQSMFHLRHYYKTVFPKLYKNDQNFEKQKLRRQRTSQNQVAKFAGDIIKGIHQQQRVFKIKYQLNLLTSMSEEDGTIMDAIANSDELSIYETDLVKDLIDFKWLTYARRQHLIGGFVHLIYVLVQIVYISHTFLELQAVEADNFIPMHAVKVDNIDMRQQIAQQTKQKDIEVDDRIFPPCDVRFMYAFAICLLYPLFYDGTQMVKQGAAYFLQVSNYIDLIHIFMGYYNIYRQMEWNGTWNIYSKIVMIIVILTSLMKTFFFMRIFTSFSYIVTMIVNVVIDLKIFLIFFAILMVMFSMIFDVITRNEAAEYSKIGYWLGNLFTTLRLSLGDFDFGMIEDKKLTKQHFLFWICWLIMVAFSSLIFLNFIIAEVSSSYNKVKRNIASLIYKERAGLINEAEDITSQKVKKTNGKKYPKYIVIRELEI